MSEGPYLVVAPEADSIEGVRRLLREHGDPPCELHPLEAVEGPAFAERIGALSPGRVLVVGGDGSLSHVVGALREHLAEIELALLPAGTGNDLARSLDLPLDDPGAALRLALEGTAVPIDLIGIRAETEERLAVNCVSGGAGSRVTSHTSRDRKERLGAFAYWATAFERLRDLPSHRLRLERDGEPEELCAYGFAIGNGRYAGGGAPIAPDALLDDGLVDLLVVPAAGLAPAMLGYLKLLLTGKDEARRVLRDRARSVRVESAVRLPFTLDGERHSWSRLEARVRPGALRIVAGPKAALRRPPPEAS